MPSSRQLYEAEIIKVILPPFLAMALFAAALFGLVLPTFKNDLWAQKKELLAAVTQTTWELLDHYEQRVAAGELDRESAQKLARQQIRDLRYGPAQNHYFWLNDLQARMLMHPYLPELEGQDLSTMSDGQERYPLREIVAAARQGSGYVQYHWPKPEDSGTSAGKLSYVQLFRPWGWVLGTGIYLDDIEAELGLVLRKSLYAASAIFALILALSLYITRANLRERRRRQAAEAELQEYQNSLEELVEERSAALREANSNLKILSGFLPICASCKQIRDDQGYWNQIEAYISAHSEAQFSHGICPDCARKLYPEIYKKE